MAKNTPANEDWSKGFSDGTWFAIQELVIHNHEPFAMRIIMESGLTESDFRDAQSRNGHEDMKMNAFLDKIYKY